VRGAEFDPAQACSLFFEFDTGKVTAQLKLAAQAKFAGRSASRLWEASSTPIWQ
jgi:hypothetical protein